MLIQAITYLSKPIPEMKCKYYVQFIFLAFFFSSTLLAAQNTQRAIAILDLSVRNSETNDARMLSVKHIMKVVGIPFVITQNVEEASAYSMIFCSSLLENYTFTSGEKDSLSIYVENGGILFAPRIQDEELFPLFGISGSESSNARFKLHWDTNVNSDAFHYINEPEEWTLSLGKDTYDAIYKTLGYNCSTAETLAHYEDGASAVTKNALGDGFAVSVGFSWKEVILRNQINRDYEAQRLSSNAFEPTSDIFMLFVRGLYADLNPHTVWKNTSPGNTKSTFMVSHDIDSNTGMDSLSVFVDYEHDNYIAATYNITVRYFDDELMSPFYLDRQSTLENILNHNQIIGSHSVGHFFDFGDDDIFPIGAAGNTMDNYTPYNGGDFTEGGTVYGECEVSKDVLEADLGVDIRSFRAGHLAFHKNLIDVLDELGYLYNSSVSAADVLTNFPFQNKKGRGFSTDISNVYELPVTISDVFHADPITSNNYMEKAAIWLDVAMKNRANGAPSVLLIHPNRHYKLVGLTHLIESLPDDFRIMEMGRFGDFWKAREVFDFESELEDDELIITIKGQPNLEDNISFIVNDGQSLLPVIVKDEQGVVLDFVQEDWEGNDVIVYYDGIVNNIHSIEKDRMAIKVYPNPSTFSINVAFELSNSEQIQIELYDMQGKKVLQLFDEYVSKGKQDVYENISRDQLAKGVYFLVVKSKAGVIGREKVVLM